MPTNNPNSYRGIQGYGSLIGLPDGIKDRAEMRRHKQRQSVSEFREKMVSASEGLPNGQDIVFQQFAEFGRMLGNKLSGGDKSGALTPEEEKDLQTMELANKKMSELRGSAEFQKLDPTQQSFAMTDALAAASFESGEIDAYLQLTATNAQRKMDYRRSNAELEKLGIENETAQIELDATEDAAEAAHDNFIKGRPQSFVRLVEGNPDMSSINTLRRRHDGTITDLDGNQVDPSEYMLLDDAAKIASIYKAQGAGTVSNTDRFKSLFTAKQRQEMDGQIRDLEKMSRISSQMSKTILNTDQPGNLTGNVGNFNRVTNDLLKTVQGVGRTVQVFASVDPETGAGVGKGMGLKAAAEKHIDDSWVPEEFRSDARAASQWKASIMQMVYADARLEEPGARQLSDADITNAMSRLGVNGTDPMAVLGVFYNNMQQRFDVAASDFQRYENKMGSRAALTEVMGADPLALIEEHKKTLGEGFNEALSHTARSQGENVPESFKDLSGFTTEEQRLLLRFAPGTK